MTEETSNNNGAPQGHEMIDDFSIGRVLRNSFSILNKNIISFGVLSLILLIPSSYFLIAPLSGQPLAVGGIDNQYAVMGMTMFIQVLFSSLLAAMLIYGTFNSMKGHQIAIGDLLSKGMSVVFPVIGLAIVMNLIIALGFILLIIPGFILMVMFYVAIPVRVVEGLSLGECLSRSSKLTDGHRWSIFGLLILLGIISMLINGGISAAAVSMGNIAIMGSLLFIATAYITALGSVVSAMVYYELRAAKEGVDIDELSRVFD